MPFSVTDRQIDIGEVNYYTSTFRNIIENHLEYFRKDTSTNTLVLNVHDEYKYRGDFYGLLLKNNIRQDMFWIVMRVNALHSPIDYDGELKVILIPSIHKINILLGRSINSIIIA